MSEEGATAPVALNTSQLAAALAEKSSDEIASTLRSLGGQEDTNETQKNAKFIGEQKESVDRCTITYPKYLSEEHKDH